MFGLFIIPHEVTALLLALCFSVLNLVYHLDVTTILNTNGNAESFLAEKQVKHLQAPQIWMF